MSSEAKYSMDASADAARMLAADSSRLSWPAAALVIGALSIAGWLTVMLIIGWLLR